MRRTRSPILLWIALAAAVSVTACNSVSDPSSTVASIKLAIPGSVVMDTVSTLQLRTVAYAVAGNEMSPSSPYTYLSRDSSVVRVSRAGGVKGVKLGSTFVVVMLDVGRRTLLDSLRVTITTASAAPGAQQQ